MNDQNKDNLHAAGSAGEEVVAWRVSHPDTAWRVYERNPESWAAGDYEIQGLMTVAQCLRMLDQQRAALSAQQSASVNADLLAAAEFFHDIVYTLGKTGKRKADIHSADQWATHIAAIARAKGDIGL